METIVEFISLHASSAHWIIFTLLMLAGLNFPISEDILLIVGGAIASTCIPQDTYYLFGWIFLGCWISAWETYWIGRVLGPKLYQVSWFSRVITKKRIARLHHYYEKFGVFTFIIGRFIPGGIRNALFLSSGLGKMPFLKFIIRDGLACSISVTTIFTIGYYFGENYAIILHYFKTYNLIGIACIFLLASIGILLWRKIPRET